MDGALRAFILGSHLGADDTRNAAREFGHLEVFETLCFEKRNLRLEKRQPRFQPPPVRLLRRWRYVRAAGMQLGIDMQDMCSILADGVSSMGACVQS